MSGSSAPQGASAGAPRWIPARPGDRLADVDTPALLLDLDAFEANVAAVHRLARELGVAVRAHGKAHKCPEIARRLVAAGAVGACCQKVGEAEVFADAGIDDLLVSNEVVGMPKLRRLARLAGRVRRLAVCVDHPLQVEQLAAAVAEAGTRIEVLIEIDVGQRRCGVETVDEALALARAISAAPGLALRGLQAYHGRAQHIRDAGERARTIAQAATRAATFREALRAAGFGCDEVSGGGSGTFAHEARSGVYTEVQPGSYALMDLDYRANAPDPSMPALRQALGVLATVISARGDRAVLDGGLKAFAVDSGLPATREAGWVTQGLSDEHAVLQAAPGARPLTVGEKVVLDPSHCDPTVNLHDWIVAFRGERVEAVWPVSARGALF